MRNTQFLNILKSSKWARTRPEVEFEDRTRPEVEFEDRTQGSSSFQARVQSQFEL